MYGINDGEECIDNTFLSWKTKMNSQTPTVRKSSTAIKCFVDAMMWGGDDDSEDLSYDNEDLSDDDEDLSISRIYQQDVYHNEIIRALAINVDLRVLVLDYARIGRNACLGLAAFLQNPTSNLEGLSLYGC